jgi:hypothetical protein
LKNIYHFLRAGPSELELQGIYSTNALFVTNRENAMHPSGEAIIDQALEVMRQQPPTIAYHSLAANGMDTGDYIARQLQLGREKLLPEFTYLDQRGIGLWNDSDETIVKPAVWALDYLEAGERGMNGRPPPTVDGTPNETLNDQFVRLRQFLSLQESRTAGDVILVIFPDGTGPALLSCMIAGIPYKDCHALEFQPGEIRLNITPESVRQLFDQRKNDPVYLETLEKGKVELKKLLEQQEDGTMAGGSGGGGGFVSLKERREDKVQADIEQAYQEKKRTDAALEAQKRQEQAARQKQVEMENQERNRIKKEERDANDRSLTKTTTTTTTTATSRQSSMDLPTMVGLGAVGLGAIALLGTAIGGGASAGGASTTTSTSENDAVDDTRESTTPNPPTLLDAQFSMDRIVNATSDTFKDETPSVDNGKSDDVVLTFSGQSSLEASTTPQDRTHEEFEVVPTEPSRSVEETLNQLALAEQAMKDALVEAGQKQQQQQQRSLFDGPVPTTTTAVSSQADDFFDDGGDDWLRVLVEIRDEEEPVLVINGNNNDIFGEF